MRINEKAIQLLKEFGLEKANIVIGLIIDELQENWNQERIDYYLDVKKYMNNLGKIH